MEVLEIVEQAIKEFNKYRSPEAKARLIKFDGKSILIEFTGTFCMTCGFYDYFDDFKLILKEKGVNAEIKNIEEMENGATVTFKID